MIGRLPQTQALSRFIFTKLLLDKQIVTIETLTTLLPRVASAMLTVSTPMPAKTKAVLARSS